MSAQPHCDRHRRRCLVAGRGRIIVLPAAAAAADGVACDVREPAASLAQAVAKPAIKHDKAEDHSCQRQRPSPSRRQQMPPNQSRCQSRPSRSKAQPRQAGERQAAARPRRRQAPPPRPAEAPHRARRRPLQPALAAAAGAAPACRLAAAAPRAQAGRPGRVAATSSTSQADSDALENVDRAGAQAQAGRCHADRKRTISDPVARKLAEWIDPAQRRQWRLGRALSRLHRRQSELAVADLPAPAHRSRAVGRPSRRRHGVGVVRERIAAVGQRQIRAGAGDARARRPGQCRASGARRLAQRSDVGGYREQRRSTCSAHC